MSTALPQLPEPAEAGIPHAIALTATRERTVLAAKPRDSPPPAVQEARPSRVRAWCVPTDPPPV